ncbi:MAG: type II secretion system F family protein [Bryobacteraceae bacterium]
MVMTGGELGILIGFFLFILAAVSVAGYLLAGRQAGATSAGDSPAAPQMPRTISIDGRDEEAGGEGILDAFRSVGDLFPAARVDTNPLRKKLNTAGYRFPGVVSVFYGVKCAGALALGILGAWAGFTFQEDPMLALMPVLCCVALGFMIPDKVLNRLATNRLKRIRRALPAALDLMVLGIEAGQAMDQAVLDASRGLRNTHPDLSREFTLLSLELRATNSRLDTIRGFAERNPDLEIRKFTNLLTDTDRFGTSLGPALRSHAKYLRIRFRQTAQERARKVGVKLIFPVFFLIFPSVILVTLGPAAILIFKQMHELLGK